MFQLAPSKSGFFATKFVIELHFVNKQVLQIAAERESDQDDWATSLHKAIAASNALDSQSVSNQSSLHP